jgi:hypothetical protein
MTAREMLLQQIVDQDELSEVRGGAWIDKLRSWYYKYGPKCGSVGLIGIGSPSWVGKMAAYAILHNKPAPPSSGSCGTCICH